jgi:hypothetical protein
MRACNQWLTALTATASLILLDGLTSAGQLRYHFVPTNSVGVTALKPAEAGGPGEKALLIGLVREADGRLPPPTHYVTFRHPYTLAPVTVPMTFAPGTPRLEHTPTRIVYNYGSYTVEARFQPDGSVDVIYDTGFLRRP